jgi:hypothetical protein
MRPWPGASGHVLDRGSSGHIAEVRATIPGRVAFNGKLTASFLVISLEGTIKGEVTSRSFYAEGGITLHAPAVSANGDGLVNNVGLAGCASAKIGVTVFGHFISKTVTVGGSHRWGGENSMFTDSCRFGRLHSALSSAVDGSGTVVSVPPHTRQLNLIVRGAGGPPSSRGARCAKLPSTTSRLQPPTAGTSSSRSARTGARCVCAARARSARRCGPSAPGCSAAGRGTGASVPGTPGDGQGAEAEARSAALTPRARAALTGAAMRGCSGSAARSRVRAHRAPATA